MGPDDSIDIELIEDDETTRRVINLDELIDECTPTKVQFMPVDERWFRGEA